MMPEEQTTESADTKTIREHQEEIAEALINSFKYARTVYAKQVEFLERVKQDTGLDILSFSPNDLLANQHVKERLLEAFRVKHGESKVYKGGTMESTLLNELAMLQIHKKR